MLNLIVSTYLFVIRQTGDTVAIANDTTFQPAAW